MLKELLTSTAVVLALASPAYAGSSDASAAGQGAQSQAVQSENPCNPCAAAKETQGDNPCAAANSCAAAKPETPCAPDAANADANADATAAETTVGTAIAAQSEDEALVETLIGMPVANDRDEEVGEVHDVLFTKDGSMSALVLSVGGFLGIGDKLVALPWDAVDVRYDEERVLIAETRDELNAAPPFQTLDQAQAEAQALEVQQEQQQEMQENLEMEDQSQQN